MGACGEPDAPPRKRRVERKTPRQIGRRRRRVGLEVADIERARDAELGKAFGKIAVLGQNEIEGREERPAQSWALPPTLIGRNRYAAIDEHQGNVQRLGFEHEIWPDFRFDQHGKIGAPMVQETLHEDLIVERHILMQDAFRHSRPCKPCRGHCRGGEKEANLRPRGRDGLDHRQRGISLADACSMEPDEEAGRPGCACQTVALGAPVQLLFAAARPPSKDHRRKRRRQARQCAIELKRQPGLDFVLHGQRIIGSG
jgi:hypothetical protein